MNQRSPSHSPMLLVLDLDETLMHVRSGHPSGDFDFLLSDDHYGMRRPHLSEFLGFVFKRFAVAVWSSASPDYVDEAVRILFPPPHQLEFVWSRPRCTFRNDPESGETYWMKDLKKVRRRGWCLDRVLALDDKAVSYRRHRGNLVQVAAFEGDRRDTELLRLIPVLDGLASAPDVRLARRPVPSVLDPADPTKE